MSRVLIALLLFVCLVGSNAFLPRTNFPRHIIRTQLSMKQSGTVKFFDATKGFGFITIPGGEDVFVHQSVIHSDGFRSLAEGEPVEFEVEEDPVKMKKFAVNVTGPNGVFVQGAPRREPNSNKQQQFYK